jgi:predicted nucleic acid-binding protein
VSAERVFCDTSVLVRYFAEDDPPRAFAAAKLIESDATLVISTGSLIELVHVLRTQHGIDNPELGEGLIRFLARDNVDLVDADEGATVAAIRWSLRAAARRIPDAILAAAAEQAHSDWIATFDERLASPTVPVHAI